MALSKCKWSDDDWQALVYAIQKGKCILMLGPETAIETVDGTEQTLRESLAQLLAQNITSPLKDHIDPANLGETAQYYSIEKGGHIYLQNKVRDFHHQRQTLTSDFHRDLAALPFALALNSSHDDMYHTALTEKGKNSKIGWYNFKHKKSYMSDTGSVDEPMVFYLYGNIRDEDSLVITDNDLLDFLVSITTKNTLPDQLLHKLNTPDNSFLFLGFGFKHWYLRILLHILGIKNKASRSFALEEFTPESEAQFNSTVLFYRDGPCKIHFYEKSVREFAAQLHSRCEAVMRTMVKPPPVEDYDKPRVFICHASEDKYFAAALHERLKTAGLLPWLDKDKLRGGGHWDEQIKRTINRDIDYFLVLQSKAMETKHVGYVNKEIHEARERQKTFRFGTRFIIPLRIEDCDVLEDLDFLQTIDLDDDQQYDELIKIIKRDYTKRGKK